MDNTDKKILVVEDDPSLRNILVDKLKLSGYKTITAVNGEEGLKAAAQFKPDLILLDILMPKMDGMTMLKGLRATMGNKLPVIILTNVDPNDKIITDVVTFQPAYYLLKSNIELDDLLTHIKDTLNPGPLKSSQ